MAEDYARERQYEYKANSNLVLTAERDRRRDTNEPTGEVESLTGKIRSTRMGDRAVTGERAPGLEEKMKKVKAKREKQRRERESDVMASAKRQKVTAIAPTSLSGPFAGAPGHLWVVMGGNWGLWRVCVHLAGISPASGCFVCTCVSVPDTCVHPLHHCAPGCTL